MKEELNTAMWKIELEACETQEREKVKRDVFLAAIDVLCEHLILCA